MAAMTLQINFELLSSFDPKLSSPDIAAACELVGVMGGQRSSNCHPVKIDWYLMKPQRRPNHGAHVVLGKHNRSSSL